jgi:hypothetical protein
MRNAEMDRWFSDALALIVLARSTGMRIEMTAVVRPVALRPAPAREPPLGIGTHREGGLKRVDYGGQLLRPVCALFVKRVWVFSGCYVDAGSAWESKAPRARDGRGQHVVVKHFLPPARVNFSLLLISQFVKGGQSGGKAGCGSACREIGLGWGGLVWRKWVLFPGR